MNIMAENFTNYLNKINFTKTDETKNLVPSDDGTTSRTKNSVVQLHSIYITKVQAGPIVTDISSNASYVHLSIKDPYSNTPYYIGYNIKLVPYSPFYIEKTITLKPGQTLELTYSGSNKTNSSSEIHCVCSGIEIF
jgi:hypothetical protein